MDNMMNEVEYEHFRNIDPNEDDMLDEIDRLGFPSGRRETTVDDQGQGLNSDEI